MRDPRDFAAVVKDLPKLKAQIRGALSELEGKLDSP